MRPLVSHPWIHLSENVFFQLVYIECFEPGTITITGPDRPTERSSGRLFGVLREDPNACVVQLIGSGKDPLTTGRCTIHECELTTHPTRETLTAVHDLIRPTHTTSSENLEAYRRPLATIAQNDAYTFDTPPVVVEAAVLWFCPISSADTVAGLRDVTLYQDIHGATASNVLAAPSHSTESRVSTSASSHTCDEWDSSSASSWLC